MRCDARCRIYKMFYMSKAQARTHLERRQERRLVRQARGDCQRAPEAPHERRVHEQLAQPRLQRQLRQVAAQRCQRLAIRLWRESAERAEARNRRGSGFCRRWLQRFVEEGGGGAEAEVVHLEDKLFQRHAHDLGHLRLRWEVCCGFRGVRVHCGALQRTVPPSALFGCSVNGSKGCAAMRWPRVVRWFKHVGDVLPGLLEVCFVGAVGAGGAHLELGHAGIMGCAREEAEALAGLHPPRPALALPCRCLHHITG